MSKRLPIEVVQQQLDAYNRRDMDAYLATFADTAVMFDLGAPLPSASGKDEIRARYAPVFANSPALHARLVNRTAFAHVVVDLEHITGRNGAAEPFEVLAIYEVREALIVRAHFVRREPAIAPPTP